MLQPLRSGKYFSVQWQNRHPDEVLNEESFTYPGPDPHTKEQAILMMCDAVEASSRSLKSYTAESITTLVNRIVDAQVSDGRFKHCPISFLDIEIAKQTLVECLQNIHHTRIAYPELKKNAAETEENSSNPTAVQVAAGKSSAQAEETKQDAKQVVTTAEPTVNNAGETQKATEQTTKKEEKTSEDTEQSIPNPATIKTTAETAMQTATVIPSKTAADEEDDAPQHSGFFHTRRKE